MLPFLASILHKALSVHFKLVKLGLELISKNLILLLEQEISYKNGLFEVSKASKKFLPHHNLSSFLFLLRSIDVI